MRFHSEWPHVLEPDAAAVSGTPFQVAKSFSTSQHCSANPAYASSARHGTSTPQQEAQPERTVCASAVAVLLPLPLPVLASIAFHRP
jgi:hypothetical protein